jgi:signal transduction histidine kinase/HAMP domain-containing protein
MQLSFRTARRLGIYALLGIIILGSTIGVVSLSRTVYVLRVKLVGQEAKARLISQVALHLSLAGVIFYQQRPAKQLDLSALRAHLDTIRRELTELRQLALTPDEQEKVIQLVREEKRFRTSVYIYVESGLNDPSQESANRALAELDTLVTEAITQTVQISQEMLVHITQANTTLLRSVQRTALLLTLVMVIAIVVGLGISAWLSRTLARPINEMLHAIAALGAGNLAHRIASPHTDEIGTLAAGIDAMAASLETTHDALHVSLTDLTQAKELADSRAHDLAMQAETLRHEIKERQQAQQALQKAHTTLERRVAERTQELVQTNANLTNEITERKRVEAELHVFAANLERSNRELQDFAYVASHDLQEPLRKIQAFGDRLKARCGEALSEQGQDYLARMQNAASRMQTLIHDLLMFSRVTTKAQPFVPVDLAQIAQEVVADLEVRIEEVNGRVEIGKLPTIDADPVQMRQLLQNLLSNALKFHQPEIPPIVTVQAHPLQEEVPAAAESATAPAMYELIVRDNGIGFDDKYTDRIFAVFQRLHGRSTYEGTGIGLAVCRKIAERHRGSITAHSTPGHGTTFVVTLPCTQPQEIHTP